MSWEIHGYCIIKDIHYTYTVYCFYTDKSICSFDRHKIASDWSNRYKILRLVRTFDKNTPKISEDQKCYQCPLKFKRKEKYVLLKVSHYLTIYLVYSNNGKHKVRVPHKEHTIVYIKPANSKAVILCFIYKETMCLVIIIFLSNRFINDKKLKSRSHVVPYSRSFF